jgi:hypothetical protein
MSDPGSGAFLPPGSGIRIRDGAMVGSGSGIKHPGSATLPLRKENSLNCIQKNIGTMPLESRLLRFLCRTRQGREAAIFCVECWGGAALPTFWQPKTSRSLINRIKHYLGSRPFGSDPEKNPSTYCICPKAKNFKS